MGLDMNLHKKTYCFNKNIQITGVDVNPERVASIVENIGYWRKANAIHRWFVQNVQDGEDDCKEYYVQREQIKELLQIVKQVLTDNSKAEELLPTQKGLFFGSSDYDPWYFEDLEDTKIILEDALLETAGDIYYSSSW